MAEINKLRAHLGMWMADTCNRYFHVLDELGVIDKVKAGGAEAEIRAKREEMLDQYVPLFVEFTLQMLEGSDDWDPPEGRDEAI